jgi:hypothetical protein
MIVLRLRESNVGIIIPCNLDDSETITTEYRDSYAAEENHQQINRTHWLRLKRNLLRQFRA